MEVPSLHPGPASLELLLLQGDHRLSHIWEGQLLTQTFRVRRVDDMWGFLRDHPLHPRIVRRLQDTSFYRIVEIGRLQLDWSLITTLIERWRLETHIFHLPIGEATITFQDVEPPDETALVGASRLQLTHVRQHLDALHTNITDDTPELHIHRYTRLLLLLMFGGVLFPNTSGNLVSLRFLHHLERLDDLHQYSWGASVLGYLYKQMCWASMGTQHDFAGFLPLLQVWALEWFLQLQPPLPPLAPGAPPPFLPLARRWVDRRGYGRAYEARHNIPLCKDLLDFMEGVQQQANS
ncbi:serine/threonine-protein phosphatase 7 long form homolog [Nicotiana tomentosiformis]|uniref:serine/threonine-protein phosphatase 7 long form homolog n=1 Tax=Nicotiana tomentosiformis TaxID=4098 RepID=UPI00388CEBE0